jgi:hypothetical protein
MYSLSFDIKENIVNMHIDLVTVLNKHLLI